jgi:2-keto-4-pentenoate hydratase/2-oxohepta-3-ene-1,7-dioic acid hydratase in catechol pathway
MLLKAVQEATMKLALYGDFRLGVIKNETVIDVSDAARDIRGLGPGDFMNSLIEHFERYGGAIEKASKANKGVPINQVRFRPSLPRPINIVCMAVNYMEDGTRPAPPPINAFLKTPSAVIGDNDTMVLPDAPASIFEGEAELAMVIGKLASNVKEADAMKYIFGFLNFVDGSARGLSNTFYQMKSWDTFAPLGPYIVTPEEIPNPQNLRVQLWNGGEIMQDYNTSDMAHKIGRCLEWVSSIHKLFPGDIISLGTNHKGLNPFMDGDRIEMEVEGLGRLRFNVRDDLKRKWTRQTRGQRQQNNLEGTSPQIAGKYTPAK